MKISGCNHVFVIFCIQQMNVFFNDIDNILQQAGAAADRIFELLEETPGVWRTISRWLV